MNDCDRVQKELKDAKPGKIVKSCEEHGFHCPSLTTPTERNEGKSCIHPKEKSWCPMCWDYVMKQKDAKIATLEKELEYERHQRGIWQEQVSDLKDQRLKDHTTIAAQKQELDRLRAANKELVRALEEYIQISKRDIEDEWVGAIAEKVLAKHQKGAE